MAQVQIKGTVYDSLGLYPIPSVSVLTSAGGGTITNNEGHYTLFLNDKDSIWFSYLNKPTRKFAVKDIVTPYAFDISLKINIPVLPTVQIRRRDYRQDSIQNRQDYAKIFDFQKPGISSGYYGSAQPGFDLDEIINAFRFKRNRRLLAFQNRLINQEQDAFIKHRFSKALIRRLTNLEDDSTINAFIETYQPSYLFTSLADEYRFQKYIKDSYERFKYGLMPPPLWREGATD